MEAVLDPSVEKSGQVWVRTPRPSRSSNQAGFAALRQEVWNRIGPVAASTHLSTRLHAIRRGPSRTHCRADRPPCLVHESGHLADARGWLDDDDPFFSFLRAIVCART